MIGEPNAYPAICRESALNAAFLFNADHFYNLGNYAIAANSIVFGRGILQESGRHMKVGRGDVGTFGQCSTLGELKALCERVYWSPTWLRTLDDKLGATHGKATVYTLVFHNITETIAAKLHEALRPEEAYLGALEVDFSYGPHLVFFRNLIGTQYRIQGRKCRLFYSMSDRENSCFDNMLEEIRDYGFDDVDWEDRGAHGTIFDDFDTKDHFSRLSVFSKAIADLLPGKANDASELVFMLEDLNPRLFWTLAAAFSALSRAMTEEEVAHASLSGRRFLEQLADVLFPPSEEPHDGRPIGKAQYRNRIWAFVGLHADAPTKVKLGMEVDRLDEEFNAGLHGNRDKARLERAFSDLAVLTGAILALNPDAARKPYYAHEANMIKFFREAVGQRPKQPI